MTVRKVGFSNSYEVIVWANRGWLLQGSWAVISLMVLVIKNSPANAGDVREAGSSPWLRRRTGERMATHSILAWRTPWTEEPGRLQSIGSQSHK